MLFPCNASASESLKWVSGAQRFTLEIHSRSNNRGHHCLVANEKKSLEFQLLRSHLLHYTPYWKRYKTHGLTKLKVFFKTMIESGWWILAWSCFLVRTASFKKSSQTTKTCFEAHLNYLFERLPAGEALKRGLSIKVPSGRTLEKRLFCRISHSFNHPPDLVGFL